MKNLPMIALMMATFLVACNDGGTAMPGLDGGNMDGGMMAADGSVPSDGSMTQDGGTGSCLATDTDTGMFTLPMKHLSLDAYFNVDGFAATGLNACMGHEHNADQDNALRDVALNVPLSIGTTMHLETLITEATKVTTGNAALSFRVKVTHLNTVDVADPCVGIEFSYWHGGPNLPTPDIVTVTTTGSFANGTITGSFSQPLNILVPATVTWKGLNGFCTNQAQCVAAANLNLQVRQPQVAFVLDSTRTKITSGGLGGFMYAGEGNSVNTVEPGFSAFPSFNTEMFNFLTQLQATYTNAYMTDIPHWFDMRMNTSGTSEGCGLSTDNPQPYTSTNRNSVSIGIYMDSP